MESFWEISSIRATLSTRRWLMLSLNHWIATIWSFAQMEEKTMDLEPSSRMLVLSDSWAQLLLKKLEVLLFLNWPQLLLFPSISRLNHYWLNQPFQVLLQCHQSQFYQHQRQPSIKAQSQAPLLFLQPSHNLWPWNPTQRLVWKELSISMEVILQLLSTTRYFQTLESRSQLHLWQSMESQFTRLSHVTMETLSNFKEPFPKVLMSLDSAQPVQLLINLIRLPFPKCLLLKNLQLWVNDIFLNLYFFIYQW